MTMRDGVHQGLTMSHCANCHVESFAPQDGRDDEHAGGRGARQRRPVHDGLHVREPDARPRTAPTPTNTYDNAIHPVTLLDIFVSRVQYDDNNGELPFDLVPKQTKQTNTLRAAYALPGDGAISGNFTHSSSRTSTPTSARTSPAGTPG